MNFTNENQGNNVYLVYSLSAEEKIDSFSLGMLRNNQITGILPVSFSQIDDQQFLKYNVSAKISVQQFFSGSVTRRRLLGVFMGICDALLMAEDYMLSPDMFVIDLNYIFANVSTCKTELVYMPVLGYDNGIKDWANFFKSIMFTTQFDQSENSEYVAKIISYLNGNPAFSIVDFKQLLLKLSQNSAGIGKPVQADYQNHNHNQANPLTVNKENSNTPLMARTSEQPVQHRQPVVEAVQMNIPVNAPKNMDNTVLPNPSQETDEPKDKVTVWTLLTHYNKENAEAYKRQKQEKKKQQTAGSSSESQQTAFRIPGQSAAPLSGMGAVDKGKQSKAGNISGSLKKTNAQPVQQQISVLQQPPVNLSGAESAAAYTEVPQNPQPFYQQASFGDTTVLDAETELGGTTVLSVNVIKPPAVNAYLVRKKNSEKILISKDIFKIGKEKSYVDYFIGDNTAISRSHANIIKNQDGYFIVDTNSTNHTYVNDKLIQSNQPVPISNGTKIQLANEEFEFVIQ